MKKLWQRSKSRVRSGQREREHTGSASQSSTKANTTSRDAPAVPPLPERSSRRPTGPDSTPRPVSRNKMQPMLIGISRPSTTLDRPGTAGSLQNAINIAADKVAQTPSSDFNKGHTRTKSPRYIDIFAIQNPKTSKTSYNEDVAARNIDVKKVAEAAVQYRYVPNSKYQEEVASRNAHGHSMSLTEMSYENLPPRSQPPRSQSSMGPGYNIPPEKLADADDIRRLHHAQLAALRQPKLHFVPKSTAQPILANVDDARRGRSAHSREVSLDQPLQHAQIPYESSHTTTSGPVSRKSIEAPRQSGEKRRSQAETSEAVQPLSHANVDQVDSILPGYQLSQSEVLERETDMRGQSRPMAETAQRPVRDRTISSTSNASSVRKAINLQNRTIMDLTGEDEEVFSNEYSESDMSRSPVLEQAHVDSFRWVQPEVINSGGMVEQRNADETGSQQKQAEEATSAPEPNSAPKQHPPEIPPPSSFSSINTIASVSPSIRLNGEPVPPSEPAISTPPKPASQVAGTRLSTVAETEPETEPETDDYLTPAEEPAHVLEISVPAILTGESDAPPAFSEQNSTDAMLPSSPISVETPKLSAPTTANSTPGKIQASPESLQSRDFIEPAGAFGVKTRDFAMSPVRQTFRSDREPNTSAKVTQPKLRAVNSEVARPMGAFVSQKAAPSSSTFDEEKFRLKQEAARAALVKLQQSLNEEFIPPPRTVRQPRNNTSRSRTRSSSSSDPNDRLPVNPTSIFSQVRDYHVNRPPVNGDIQPRTSSNKHNYSVQEPTSSSARPYSSASAVTVKPVRGQRSPSSQVRNRNPELESSLDGMRRLAEEMRNRPNPRPIPSRKHVVAQKQDTSNRNSNSTNSTSESEVLPSPGEISLSAFPRPSSKLHSRDPSLNLPIQNPADASPPITTRNSLVPHPKQVAQVIAEDAAPSPVIGRSPVPVPTPPKSHISRFQRDTQPQTQPSSSSQPGPSMFQPMAPQSPGERNKMSRRGSTQSQASAMTSSSQFSIPFHLIPERGSSMRDSMVQEADDEL